MGTRALTRAGALVLVAAAMGAQAQNCPSVDPAEQKAQETQCRAAGGEWGRFGVHAYLCGIHSCAPRTRDGGRPCRSRADCEHLCITNNPPKVGAEAVGHCSAVKTNFGCFTHVDGGRIVGRVCVD